MSSIPLLVDLKTLSCVDLNPIDFSNVKSDPVDTVKQLVYSILALPKHKLPNVDVAGVFAKLPISSTPAPGSAPATLLPREKPVPTRKPMTRWEKFASDKGIKKTVKKRVAWNEEKGAYVPLFGYKNQGNKDKDLSDWIKEVGADQDPNEDLYKTQRDEKKARVAKNVMQQKRNFEEATGATKQRSTLNKTAKAVALKKTLFDAKKSTASMGQFDNLDDGVKLKGSRQKFEKVTKDHKVETSQALKIADKLEKNGYKTAPVAKKGRTAARTGGKGAVNARQAIKGSLNVEDRKSLKRSADDSSKTHKKRSKKLHK